MSHDAPKDTADQAVSRARAKLGDAQAVVADQLDAGAAALRSHAHHGASGALVERASSGLEATAYGLREHDLWSVIGATDVRIRERPWQAVGLALVVGALAGMAFGRLHDTDR